jgi:membrane protein required for colicin V production
LISCVIGHVQIYYFHILLNEKIGFALAFGLKKEYFRIMNVWDIIVLVCLSYGFFRGLIKGFVVEIAGVIALFLGVLGAVKFASGFALFVHSQFHSLNPTAVQVVCFLMLFIGIVYGISLLAKMLTKTLQIVALGFLNRLAGGVFGLLKWTVLISTFVLVIDQLEGIVSVLPEASLQGSVTYPFFVELSSFLFEWVSQKTPSPLYEII